MKTGATIQKHPQTTVLTGDSSIHCDPYTTPQLSVTTLLQQALPHHTIHRIANDGDTTTEMARQINLIKKLEGPIDNIILSIGGNNLIYGLLKIDPRGKTLEELGLLFREKIYDIEVGKLATSYEKIVYELQTITHRLILCTIYKPAELRDPNIDNLQEIANQVIDHVNSIYLEIARRLGHDIIDLSQVCTTPEDYTIMIEPSAEGAAKIAKAFELALTTPPDPNIAIPRIFTEQTIAPT